MKVLLDANAYSLLMRGHGEVAGLVRRAEEVLFSAIVVGELMYGFRRGTHFERNAAALRAFLDSPYSSFVEVGPVTADRYSRIAAALRAKGRPIPTNDVWIAAHAMETGADLVSADGHFGHVDGIVWVRGGRVNRSAKSREGSRRIAKALRVLFVQVAGSAWISRNRHDGRDWLSSRSHEEPQHIPLHPNKDPIESP